VTRATDPPALWVALRVVLRTELFAACIVAPAAAAAPPVATPAPAVFTALTPEGVVLRGSAESLGASTFFTPTDGPALTVDLARCGVAPKVCADDLIDATFWGAPMILVAPEVA
jgi:hypothetical protein